MQYNDRERIATAAVWCGVLGALLLRLFDLVDWMRRPELRRVEDFRERYGELGMIVLQAYNTVNPFHTYDEEKAPGAYLVYAVRFMESWTSEAYADVGKHGRVGAIVHDSFGADTREVLWQTSCIRDIVDRIWWRAFLVKSQ
ncbi:MAG: hypothetical protein Q7R85_04470 [bacterium]|nr:hypothetical protein [bacterium]